MNSLHGSVSPGKDFSRAAWLGRSKCRLAGTIP